MMEKLLSFIAILLFAAATAQEVAIPAKFLSSAKSGPERYIGSDTYGWQYTVLDNEFRKEKDGRMLKYKALSLGEIYRADLQNPLQIILFYRKFNTVVLLDNQMNETSRINFSNIQEPLIAEAVGLASQNRLWIYDVTTQQIGLYNLAQGTFRTLTPPFTDGIKYYHNDYNYFYWVDTANRCYAVNLFGKVSTLGTLPDYDQIQIVSPTLILLAKDGVLYHFNTVSGVKAPIAVVEKSFESFYYAGEILSIFTNHGITYYQLILK
ncbi:hypothetical protein HYN59_07590 [Flavobacterium album]|uniref:Uncharacterized protein n=1 Tax=Flavobacterium album TaxID=2175091 RepID=A0A2S1QX86_9FLAO|nr:hypothetical protein [Flavobacterium album]AWH84995.1 hypothetical protein HYN59_07590 [Flavobacterium album]